MWFRNPAIFAPEIRLVVEIAIFFRSVFHPRIPGGDLFAGFLVAINSNVEVVVVVVVAGGLCFSLWQKCNDFFVTVEKKTKTSYSALTAWCA